MSHVVIYHTHMGICHAILLQASSFLMAPNKARMSLDDIMRTCPALNLQQLYRLCTTCWDDSPPPAPPPLPPQLQPPAMTDAIPGPVPTSPTAEAGAGAGAASPEDVSVAVVGEEAAAGGDGAGAGDSTASGADSSVMAESGALPGQGAQAAAGVAQPMSPTGAAPPVALDMVSGEVLEEMKERHVSSNGGLVVTCILDDDSKPIIAPQVGGGWRWAGGLPRGY